MTSYSATPTQAAVATDSQQQTASTEGKTEEKTSEDGQTKSKSWAWHSNDGTTKVVEKTGPGYYSKVQVFRSIGSSNP